MAKIERAAQANRIALGNITRNWDQARELYGKGYQFLTLCSDTSLLVQGADAMVSRVRQDMPA
jgi:2-keto-3-deoxy-L-rhamnonate aldolase RhmA